MERGTYLFTILLAAILLGSCGDPPTPSEPAPVEEPPAPPPMNGERTIQIPGGGHMTGNMVDGERDGPWTSYFPNGTIRSKAMYNGGLRDGAVEVYHPNGMTYYSGHFLNDKEFGEWTFFDEQGAKVRQVTYDSLGVVQER
ncbi:MAG: hypothetical protein KDC03_20055 [Flavobacteriales bacterium]|nr:hypothetical protein [Flavobacteriales bacterium]